MHTSADPTREPKGRAIANSAAQKKSSTGNSMGTGESHEVQAQSNLQEMANSSPQAKQAATLQAMANRYAAQQQHPFQKKDDSPSRLKSQASGPPVVQRALNPEDKVTFLEWVEEQFVAKGIAAKFHDAVLKAAEDAAGSFVVTTLQQAKDRMGQPGGFPKFEARTALTNIAGRANRSEGITMADVEAVLVYLGNVRTAQFLSHGETVHLRMLPGGDLDKNCHHYAFGGLKGEDAAFNYNALSERLNLDAANNGDTIDASVIDGVDNGGPFTVRNYGFAHSSRVEGGKTWHKFVGVPCLFAIDEFPDLGNALVKTFSVRSSAADVTGTGTFNLGPPEDAD